MRCFAHSIFYSEVMYQVHIPKRRGTVLKKKELLYQEFYKKKIIFLLFTYEIFFNLFRSLTINFATNFRKIFSTCVRWPMVLLKYNLVLGLRIFGEVSITNVVIMISF